MSYDYVSDHKAESPVIPRNIRLIFLPAYSPELNPVERFRQHIKRDIRGKNFSVLQEMKDYIADILKKCSEETIASLTGFSYTADLIDV